MAKAKGLSKADLQLWAAYSQTLKLLPGKTRLAPVPVAALPAPVAVAPPAKIKTRPQGKQIEVGSPPPGLDKSSWRNLSTPRMRSSFAWWKSSPAKARFCTGNCRIG
jgi:hypothetical protein